MNEKENKELVKKSTEHQLLNPAEQFEFETRLSCAPERLINPVIIKREKPTFFDRIKNVSFSKNGKFLIAYNLIHIYVISIPSGKCTQVIETNNRDNFASAISANGKYILSTGRNVERHQDDTILVRKIIVWNTVLGTKCFEIEDREMDTILKVELTADDQKIIVLGYVKNKQRKLSVYDFQTRKLSYRIGETINDFVTTPDGKHAYFSEMDQVQKLDLKTGNIVGIYQCEQFIVDLAISADGKMIVGLEGGKLNDDVHRFYHINKTNFCVIDLDTDEMKLIKTDYYHEKLWLHPSGKYLISRCCSSGVQPWDYKRLIAWDSLQGTPKDIGINLHNETYPMYFSPDGKSLIEMKDSGIIFWDLDQKEKFTSINYTQSNIERSIVCVNNNKMLLWNGENSLDQVDLENGFVENNLIKFNNIKDRNLKVNKGESLIAFTPEGKTLVVWDIEKEREIFSCGLNYQQYFDAVAFSFAQKDEIIAYRDDRNILLRNLNRGTVSQIPKSEGLIKELHFCRDAKTIYSKGYPLDVWYDIELARPIVTFRKPKDHSEYAGQEFGKINTSYIDYENMTCFIADTRTDPEKRQIHLFDIKHTQFLKTFTGYSSDVTDMCVDQDMRTFISIHEDGEIRKWSIETGQCMQLFSNAQNIGFDSMINYLEITENNKYLVMGSHSNQISFWDYQRGELLAKTYNLGSGYFWITPPDEFAPNGWLHTNRPDLISLIEMNKGDQGNPTFICEDDQRFKDYMRIYNDPDMVMTRLNDWDRYQELLNFRLGSKNSQIEHLLKQGDLILRLLPDDLNKQ